MAKNIIEKVWDAHVVEQKDGHPAIFHVDLLLMHEVTSAQAFKTLEKKGISVFNPDKCLATIDHSIPTRVNRHEIFDNAAKNQVETLRKNCKTHGITLYDMDSGKQGIVHVVGPELGATQPGMTIACGDSHTATHGAFGAIAFGIGTSEVGHVLATQCLLQQKPKTMKVEFKGQFQKGVYPKDAIMKLIAEIGIGGGNGHIIEYCGDAVESMSMEERMTVCNMSIECGARAGLVAPDKVTFDYIEGREFAPKGEDFDRALQYWKTLKSDEGSSYDKEITINVSELEPMLTWGTNPEQAIQLSEQVPFINDLPEAHQPTAQKAIDYVQLAEGSNIEATPVDWAFVGSCTNGRIEDIRLTAEILKGNKVSEDVTFYVVPGSEQVMKQAQEEGLDVIIKEAGADFRNPGCSMCLGMNDDRVPAGKRCISSSNRNFVGRQGTGSFTHLASPATVAASAIAGKITHPNNYL